MSFFLPGIGGRRRLPLPCGHKQGVRAPKGRCCSPCGSCCASAPPMARGQQKRDEAAERRRKRRAKNGEPDPEAAEHTRRKKRAKLEEEVKSLEALDDEGAQSEGVDGEDDDGGDEPLQLDDELEELAQAAERKAAQGVAARAGEAQQQEAPGPRQPAGSAGAKGKKQKKPRWKNRKTAFVNQLPYTATVEQVVAHFAEGSGVPPTQLEVRLVTHRKTGAFRGIAFIDLRCARDFLPCLAWLHVDYVTELYGFALGAGTKRHCRRY
jgi:hypothetical protein